MKHIKSAIFATCLGCALFSGSSLAVGVTTVNSNYAPAVNANAPAKVNLAYFGGHCVRWATTCSVKKNCGYVPGHRNCFRTAYGRVHCHVAPGYSHRCNVGRSCHKFCVRRV